MEALRGAFAAGPLPGPETRARLGLLLAVSLAAHLASIGALPRLMSGVSPGSAAVQSRAIRVSLRPVDSAAPSPAVAQNASPAPAPAPAPVPSIAPPVAAPVPAPAAPVRAAATPEAPQTPTAAPTTGPNVGPVPVPGPPSKKPPAESAPHRGSELAAADAKGPLAGPAYLHLKEVDRRPAPITRIEPVYPPEAGTASGRVVVRLLINEDGGIDRIEIVSADPPGLFEKATLEAFGTARYQPALKTNVRVKSQLTFEVKFEPEDAPMTADRLPPMRPTGPPLAPPKPAN